MKYGLLLLGMLLAVPAGAAPSPEAVEFMEIAKQLEPLHCARRKLRREILLAETERRDSDARALRAKFAALDKDPKTAALEKRLGELERKIVHGAGSAPRREDIEAISYQQRDAYHRCE